MTSTALKHQARLQDWAEAIQECRSSGLSVTLQKIFFLNCFILLGLYYWQLPVFPISPNIRKLESNAARFINPEQVVIDCDRFSLL